MLIQRGLLIAVYVVLRYELGAMGSHFVPLGMDSPIFVQDCLQIPHKILLCDPLRFGLLLLQPLLQTLSLRFEGLLLFDQRFSNLHQRHHLVFFICEQFIPEVLESLNTQQGRRQYASQELGVHMRTVPGVEHAL